MSHSPLELLKHILDEVEFFVFCPCCLASDETRKRAFVRSLEIIGEATKNITKEFQAKYPDVAWKSMARMRDRLIHHYFGVDYPIVWDTVQTDIPILKTQIQEILREENGV
jgi:uncharacterized protein with HEPN domain